MKKFILLSIMLLISLVMAVNIQESSSAATLTKIDAGRVQGSHTEKVVYTFSCKYSYLGKKTFPLVVKQTFQWNTYQDKSKPNFLRVNGVETTQYRIITSGVNLPREVSKNIHQAYDITRFEKYNCFLEKKGSYIYTYETFGSQKMSPYRFRISDSVLKYYWSSLRPSYYKKWYASTSYV